MLSENGLKVKKQLEDLNQSKRRIRNLRNELRELLELGTLPKRSDTSLPSGKGGHPSSPQEKYLIRVEDLKEKISMAIDTALKIEHEFLDSIDSLDELSQNLLMERYMQGKPLQKIIREFNYSESHIYRIYNKAFEDLGSGQNKR